jgi:hypothetical protein
MLAPKLVNLWRAIRRSNGEAAECCLQGFEQILAEPAASLNRQLWIIGQIGHSFDRSDFTEQEILHEKGSRESDSRKVLSGAHGHGCFHDSVPFIGYRRRQSGSCAHGFTANLSPVPFLFGKLLDRLRVLASAPAPCPVRTAAINAWPAPRGSCGAAARPPAKS